MAAAVAAAIDGTRKADADDDQAAATVETRAEFVADMPAFARADFARLSPTDRAREAVWVAAGAARGWPHGRRFRQASNWWSVLNHRVEHRCMCLFTVLSERLCHFRCPSVRHHVTRHHATSSQPTRLHQGAHALVGRLACFGRCSNQRWQQQTCARRVVPTTLDARGDCLVLD
jgi:hypothetical protein